MRCCDRNSDSDKRSRPSALASGWGMPGPSPFEHSSHGLLASKASTGGFRLPPSEPNRPRRGRSLRGVAAPETFKYEAAASHLDPTEGICLVAFPAVRRRSLAETGLLDGRTGLTIPSASAAAIPREGRSPRACRSPRHRSPSMLRPGEGDARIMRPPQRGVDKISEISRKRLGRLRNRGE